LISDPRNPSRQVRRNGARSAANGGMPRRRRASLYRPRFRRRRRALRVLLIATLLLALFLAAGVVVVFAGYNFYKGQLPDTAAVAADEPPQDTYVYDASGQVIHVYHGPPRSPTARHTHVALADVSRWARLATIDIEDRHFYSEGSWDLPRIFAAAVHDVTHSGGTQGASTITEQLAKLSFAGDSTPRSLDYKIKEIVLGNEIASNFSKDQILEMYLNRIPYGNFSIGIQTAAQMFFHVDASQLDLAQSALLAGLPESPSYLDPLNDPTSSGVSAPSKARQLTVLQAMVANGDITQAQADAAYKEHLTVYSWLSSEPHVDLSFIDYLTSYLEQHYGDSYVNGWKIFTTLNPKDQVKADAIVNKQVAQGRAPYNMHDAALVSIDPQTGEVLDMTGTWNYNDKYFGDLNMATTWLNPGSTVKLFTYTAAIASGKYTMTTPILDEPYTFAPPGCTDPKCQYVPHNYDGRYHGVCQLKKCLGNSFNMPAVKVEVGTGIPYITNLAYAAGVRSLAPQVTCYNSVDRRDVSNAPGPYDFTATLGFYNCGITLLDLANGAATVADLGVEHDAIPVKSIVDGNGNTLFSYNPNAVAHRVVASNAAFIINQIISNDTNRQPEFPSDGPLVIPGWKTSAKTGTGEGGTPTASGVGFMDNLTVGWTPDLLTAVWVGNPSPWCTPHLLAIGEPCGELTNLASGITGAAPIWHDFMVAALPGTPHVWYSTPKDIVQSGSGDDANYYLPSTQSNGYSGGCYYWGPAPEPNNPCLYTGSSPPPWYSPGPVGPTPSPAPEPHRRHRGGGNPTPPAT
jgi:membrane peptidoglycan carboxypeptidase